LKKRKEIKRQWWYVSLRSLHFFAFKYWAGVLLSFFLLVGLWLWFCFLPYCENKVNCCEIEEYKNKVKQASRALEDCCNCREVQISQEEIDELRRDYGGNVGEITITLAWETIDDLDLYLVEPSGEKIYFDHPKSASNGELDIDKNAGENLVNNPIENIFYANNPPSGKYSVHVHYFKKNSSITDIPYKVYINIGDERKVINGRHYNENDIHGIYEFIIP